MRFISFFLKPTRRKRAVSIAAITAAAVVAAIALILWLLQNPKRRTACRAAGSATDFS